MPRKKYRAVKHELKYSYLVGVITVSVAAVASLVLWTVILNRPPCANSISCIKDLSGAYEPEKNGVFMGKNVVAPAFAPAAPEKRVLGETTAEKHIYVDLSTQQLYAYEGSKLIYNFTVSTGKWGPTPTGDFRIWVKLRYTHMEGGEKDKGTYYNLYNVPYVMFFYNDQVGRGQGYSLHGAYWHDNFGYPMSHGCVNMKPRDAAMLFDWAEPATTGPTTYPTDKDPGTIVTIYGQPPAE